MLKTVCWRLCVNDCVSRRLKRRIWQQLHFLTFLVIFVFRLSWIVEYFSSGYMISKWTYNLDVINLFIIMPLKQAKYILLPTIASWIEPKPSFNSQRWRWDCQELPKYQIVRSEKISLMIRQLSLSIFLSNRKSTLKFFSRSNT